MELNELKQIWDSQNQEPLYALNGAALHRLVQQRSEEWQRESAGFYQTEIRIGLSCGALMLAAAGLLAFTNPATLPWIRISVTAWDSIALLAAAAIWFYYTAYMAGARRRQQARAAAFDSTLVGDLERALAETHFQAALARDIVWWGLVPVWIAAALWVITLFRLEAAPFWAYALLGLLAAGAFFAVVNGKQRSITHRFEPRRRELEALRAKLADPQR